MFKRSHVLQRVRQEDMIALGQQGTFCISCCRQSMRKIEVHDHMGIRGVSPGSDDLASHYMQECKLRNVT
jgi:hypothetical protein